MPYCDGTRLDEKRDNSRSESSDSTSPLGVARAIDARQLHAAMNNTMAINERRMAGSLQSPTSTKIKTGPVKNALCQKTPWTISLFHLNRAFLRMQNFFNMAVRRFLVALCLTALLLVNVQCMTLEDELFSVYMTMNHHSNVETTSGKLPQTSHTCLTIISD